MTLSRCPRPFRPYYGQRRPPTSMSRLATTTALLLCGFGAAAAELRPNILWFNPDEMRASAAYDEASTPHLDRLAAGGVRFDACHTSHTTCSQSRAAFMTGWPTHVRGHRSLWSLLRDDEPQVRAWQRAPCGHGPNPASRTPERST